ncbi:MAG: alginate lyase family protein [Gammaproteobacteria bacterium]
MNAMQAAPPAMRYFPVVDQEACERGKIDAILDNIFTLNGETHRLPEPIDWARNPSADREWHILLHKFYYATGLGLAFHETGARRYLDQWVVLTRSWIEQAPADFCHNPELRADASQIAGRRIQNWLYAYHYCVLDNHTRPIDKVFHPLLLESLRAQVGYLLGHLSPARNHRTLELYAVFLAAVAFPQWREASDWLAFARREIIANIANDLLADGVHCELSTDYHHLVLRNYLCVRRLAKMNGIALPAAVDEALIKALEFAMYAHKPDGVVPALSDGDARGFAQVLHWGHELYGRADMLYVATQGAAGTPPARRVAGFGAGGYYFLRSGWGERGEAFHDERYLVFDCGPLGAGNHGHFDLLSIELAGYGRSLVVDPGRYTYYESGAVNWRARFRATAAHNTVVVDGKNQTRYGPLPGKHRYKIQGPPPRHELKAFISGAGFDYLHGAAHSAEYDAVHERKIAFIAGEYWLVVDMLRSSSEHDYELLFHLGAPAQGRVEVHPRRGCTVIATPQLLIAQAYRPDVKLELRQGWISARYGEKHRAPVVCFQARARDQTFATLLYPYAKAPPALSFAQRSGVTGALTLRIEVQHVTRYCVDECVFTAHGEAPFQVRRRVVIEDRP